MRQRPLPGGSQENSHLRFLGQRAVRMHSYVPLRLPRTFTRAVKFESQIGDENSVMQDRLAEWLKTIRGQHFVGYKTLYFQYEDDALLCMLTFS